ncbi:MAG: glycosyltransferase family 2 protein [Sarcina sp.]
MSIHVLKTIDFNILFYLFIFGLITSFYRIFISFFCFKKPIRDYELAEDKHTFLFLIPACNEEAVIGETLMRLKQLEYSTELYDVCVLVNNSKDETFKRVEKSGFRGLDIEFKENEPKGKPHVLRKFFEGYEFWHEFEYICILDADNIISTNYLLEMNSQIISKKDKNNDVTVIQGYLGVKNPFSTLVSAGYGGAYFISNRIYQYAKYRLGFNAAIGGTGFVIDKIYIEENGWKPKTYTEDFELQIELSLKERRVYWNHFAEVYDEKPLTLRQAIRQRNRWAQGHWKVAITTTPFQIFSMFNLKRLNRIGSKLDAFVYSYSMIRPILILDFIFNVLIFRNRLPNYLKLMFISLGGIYLILSIYVYILAPLFALYKEGAYLYEEKKWRKILLFYLASYYISYTYWISQVIGFITWFKKQNRWAKTSHSIKIITRDK